MQRISLKNMLPKVFSGLGEVKSDIWQQNVTFERGKLYLVEAASGTGKSSLCSYILGYRNDYEGKLYFDDRDARSLTIPEWVDIRKHSISILFQELRLFPELTALENVQIKNTLTGHKSDVEIKEWFERLGIADKTDTPVRFMSFGQQQRVAMIRALVCPFDFLLADEPISHLDDANAAVMADIMMTEAHRQGAGVIVTSIGKHMNLSYDHIFKL